MTKPYPTVQDNPPNTKNGRSQLKGVFDSNSSILQILSKVLDAKQYFSLVMVRFIEVLLTCFLLAVVVCEDSSAIGSMTVLNAQMPTLTISAPSQPQASDMLNNPLTQSSALVANLSPASSDLSQAQPGINQSNQDDSSNQGNDDSNGDDSGEIDVPVTGSLSSQTMTSGSASSNNLTAISTLSGNVAGDSQNGLQLPVLVDAATQNGQIATGSIQTTVLSYSPVAFGAAGSQEPSDGYQPEGDSDNAYAEDDSEEPLYEGDETPNSAATATPASAPLGIQAPSTASSQVGNFVSQSPAGPVVNNSSQQGGSQPVSTAALDQSQQQQTTSSVPVASGLTSGQQLISAGTHTVTPIIASSADSQAAPSSVNPVPASQISSQPSQQQAVDPQPTPSPQNIVKAISANSISQVTSGSASANTNGQPAADSQTAQAAPVSVFTAALNLPTSLLVSSNQISTDASQPQSNSSSSGSDSAVSASVGTPSLSIQSQPNLVLVQAASTDAPTAAPLQPNLTGDNSPAAATSGLLPNLVSRPLSLASPADAQNPQVTVLPPLIPLAPESAKVDTVLVYQDPSQPDDGHKELNLTGNSGYQLAFYSPQLHELWPFRLFVSNHPKAASRVPTPAGSDIAQGNIQSHNAIVTNNQ